MRVIYANGDARRVRELILGDFLHKPSACNAHRLHCEPCRQELCESLSRITLTLLCGCDAVLEIVNDDVRTNRQRPLEHTVRRGWH
jgi:hypothetical protein